jgi:hypothetical protein
MPIYQPKASLRTQPKFIALLACILRAVKAGITDREQTASMSCTDQKI